jgi:hypothetical protein
MKMDDVGAVLSNVPEHAGTYWGARDGNRNVDSGYRNSIDHAVLAVPVIAGHQHPHVHRFPQSLAKRLDVRLNAAEVRPIELANVQDALFFYVTQVSPESSKVLTAVGTLVGIAPRWSSSEFGQTPAIAYTAIDNNRLSAALGEINQLKQRDRMLGDNEAWQRSGD